MILTTLRFLSSSTAWILKNLNERRHFFKPETVLDHFRSSTNRKWNCRVTWLQVLTYSDKNKLGPQRQLNTNTHSSFEDLEHYEMKLCYLLRASALHTDASVCDSQTTSACIFLFTFFTFKRLLSIKTQFKELEIFLEKSIFPVTTQQL